jgi:hypothetical protein
MTEEKILTLQEASKVSPYRTDYLSLLMRKGKIEGFKKDGKCYITEKSLKKYLNRIAEANYSRQTALQVKISEVEMKKNLTNLKWALALAIIAILGLLTWNGSGKMSSDEFKIEKDAQNNLVIHVDDPSSIGSVTIMPK